MGGITLPTDEENYLVLDVDPDCWKILVQFLQTRRLAPNCPTPPVPPEKWRNMEELLDALNIKAFSKPNRINRFTRTSLEVTILFNETAVLYNSGNGLNGGAYENDT